MNAFKELSFEVSIEIWQNIVVKLTFGSESMISKGKAGKFFTFLPHLILRFYLCRLVYSSSNKAVKFSSFGLGAVHKDQSAKEDCISLDGSLFFRWNDRNCNER